MTKLAKELNNRSDDPRVNLDEEATFTNVGILSSRAMFM